MLKYVETFCSRRTAQTEAVTIFFFYQFLFRWLEKLVDLDLLLQNHILMISLMQKLTYKVYCTSVP